MLDSPFVYIIFAALSFVFLGMRMWNWLSLYRAPAEIRALRKEWKAVPKFSLELKSRIFRPEVGALQWCGLLFGPVLLFCMGTFVACQGPQDSFICNLAAVFFAVGLVLSLIVYRCGTQRIEVGPDGMKARMVTHDLEFPWNEIVQFYDYSNTQMTTSSISSFRRVFALSASADYSSLWIDHEQLDKIIFEALDKRVGLSSSSI